MEIAPVLFIVFNRPEVTKQVFQSIRRAKPARLYIAADGPRRNRPGEDILCKKVLEIVSEVDWECELKILKRDQNLGCKFGVSSAITWFFQNEEEGIILEDDCLPDPTFFRYCSELLERYRSTPQVMIISGSNYPQSNYIVSESYFFSRYNLIWGWASWRRAWQQYDLSIRKWPELRNTDWLFKMSSKNGFQKHWENVFDITHAGMIDTWDYQWVFSCWVNKGLAVHPTKNLIKNLGFGIDATHTTGDGGWLSRLPLDKMIFPMIHPEIVSRDEGADNWLDDNVFVPKIPFYVKIIQKFPVLAMLKRQLFRKKKYFFSNNND